MKTHLSPMAREAMRGERGEPLLLAEWAEAVFLHYAVNPAVLTRCVPYPLDLRNGQAFVSCVAFTMRDMRLRRGPAWLMRPVATHPFLNVRTYVRDGDERGIYFLAEWLPNTLSVLLGPALFGLPYRHGTLRYRHCPATGLDGHVEDTRSGKALNYTAGPLSGAPLISATPDTLEEFLFERYSAFTMCYGLRRRFRVWHPAWRYARLELTIHDDSLLGLTGVWHQEARFIGAHFAPGFKDVWMGRPRLLGKPDPPQKPRMNANRGPSKSEVRSPK